MASGDFAGAEAAIADAGQAPKGAERAAVLRTKLLAKQGKHNEAIAELDKLIASSPKGSERQRAAQLAKAESLAAHERVHEGREPVARGDPGNPPEDAAAQAPAYNTSATASAPPIGPRTPCSPISTPTCSTARTRKSIPRALHQIS